MTQPRHLLLAGLDYRTAKLELRERVARYGESVERLLEDLVADPAISEAFVLSTCNRTETYALCTDEAAALQSVLELTFGDHLEALEAEDRLFVLRDREAAAHLLQVAAGLESMVLGEPEILGQVKHAAEQAEACGAFGQTLRRLVRCAVGTGGRARTETKIGAGAVSLGYAVVEIGRQIFTRLDETKAVVIGAGVSAGLALTALREKGVQQAAVVNRGAERAAAFVDRFPGTSYVPFEDRYEALASADIAVGATSAKSPVIDRPSMEAVMKRRPARPLLFVDLGVPRNVVGDVGKIENLFLHDIDSLRHLIDRNLELRKSQVPRVREIASHELGGFFLRERGRIAEPFVATLQRWADEVRRREVDRVRERFPGETHDDLEQLTRSIVRRILHHPSARLRAGGPDHATRLELARELFQLDSDERERS